MVDIALVDHIRDGGPPRGQYHASEHENVLRALAGFGVREPQVIATITGGSRTITVPAFSYTAADSAGEAHDVEYEGGEFTPAAGGAMPRLDILVAHYDGTLEVIQGVETQLSNTVVEPPMPDLPDGAILLLKIPLAAGQGTFRDAESLQGRAIYIGPPDRKVRRVERLEDSAEKVDTTVEEDEYLRMGVEAGKSYFFEMVLDYSNQSSPDLKFAFGRPAGRFTIQWRAAGSTQSWSPDLLNNVETSIVFSTAWAPVEMHGFFHPTEDGELVFKWAQNSLNAAAPIKMGKGSWMRLTEVGAE